MFGNSGFIWIKLSVRKIKKLYMWICINSTIVLKLFKVANLKISFQMFSFLKSSFMTFMIEMYNLK